MVLYDWLMIGVLVLSIFQGAWRGLAWQLAPIASLVLGYMVAIPMSHQFAPYFGDRPSSRFIAILVLYSVVSLSVYMIARALRDSIERIKLQEFDRHLGAIFGGMKGVLIALVVTFFAVGLSEQTRDHVLHSYSGILAGEVIHHLEPVMPEQMEALLEPHLARLHNPKTHKPPTVARTPEKPAKQPEKTVGRPNERPTDRSNDEPSLPAFLDDVLRIVERIEAQQRK